MIHRISTVVLTVGISCTLLGAGCAVIQPENIPAQTNTATTQTETQNGGTMANLSNQGLTTLPGWIVKQTTLTDLDLSRNALTGSLPAEIRHLTNLRTLNISNNRFTGLPAELGQLEQLQVLDVSNNLLTGLPYELGNLKNLKRFVLTGNAFSEQDLAVILKTLPNVVVVR